MFTGIVQQLGTVKAFRKGVLTVAASFNGIRLGQSLAVNGTCLTVTHWKRSSGRRAEFSFHVSPETRALTNLSEVVPGEAVNLEPPLRMGDFVGGHWVTGHVDGPARILLKTLLSDGSAVLRVALPRKLHRHVARKGSIAVDGVSLTVTGRGRDFFEAALIPHTLSVTTLGRKRPGDAVNLEVDLLSRYLKT